MNPRGAMNPRRLILGFLAIAMLVAALLVFLARGFSGTDIYLVGVLVRVGIVLLTIFLAWPALEKHASRIPAFLTAIVLAGLLFFAIRPRLLPLIVAMIVVVLAVHYGLRAITRRLDK